MFKAILIGLAILFVITLFVLFPWACGGILVALFCVWTKHYIAAGICFVLGIIFQVMLWETSPLCPGGGSGSVDYDHFHEREDDGVWRPDAGEIFVAYKASEHYRDKNKN